MNYKQKRTACQATPRFFYKDFKIYTIGRPSTVDNTPPRCRKHLGGKRKCARFDGYPSRFGDGKNRSLVQVGTLILDVSDVFRFGRIKYQVADGSHDAVNAERHNGQQQIASGAGGVALRLQRRMVDDETADPIQEESQQKANKFLILHNKESPFQFVWQSW